MPNDGVCTIPLHLITPPNFHFFEMGRVLCLLFPRNGRTFPPKILVWGGMFGSEHITVSIGDLVGVGVPYERLSGLIL